MNNSLFDLTDKVVIVTGGAGYLGRAMCDGLAQYNAIVVVASRNLDQCQLVADEVKEKYNATTFAIELDITVAESVKNCMATIYEKYGKIDILINNASQSTPGYIQNIDYELWQKGMDGTINGVYKCVREVLPYMEKKNKGKIINIASMYGQIAPNPSIYNNEIKLNSPPNYGAGKAAIIQFTKYLASYYGRKGILANTLCPGSFPTITTQQNDEFIQHLANKTMLGRIGNPDELKGSIVFLASDASSYMTGQTLNIDGGVTSW